MLTINYSLDFHGPIYKNWIIHISFPVSVWMKFLWALTHSSLAVLFLDSSRNMLVKVYPSMSVETCACR